MPSPQMSPPKTLFISVTVFFKNLFLSIPFDFFHRVYISLGTSYSYMLHNFSIRVLKISIMTILNSLSDFFKSVFISESGSDVYFDSLGKAGYNVLGNKN